MALKRIKGTFFTSFEGRRYTFRAGTVVDESHPALSNALRKRYLDDIVNDYPFQPAASEAATAEPGERRDVAIPPHVPARVQAAHGKGDKGGAPDVSAPRKTPTPRPVKD